MNILAVANELVRVAGELMPRIASIGPNGQRLPKEWNIQPVDTLGMTDVEAYTYELRGQPCYVIFKGKGTKSYSNYRFPNEHQRDRQLHDDLRGLKITWDQEQKEKAAKDAYKHDYKAGDILSATWGYDQTQTTYYQVLAVTDKQIKIREIKKKYISDTRSMPLPNQFDNEPVITKAPGLHGVKLNSYMWAEKWDGNPGRETESSGGH